MSQILRVNMRIIRPLARLNHNNLIVLLVSDANQKRIPKFLLGLP